MNKQHAHRILVILIFSILMWSCNKGNDNCKRHSDIEFYINTYNATMWRPFLSNRKSKDTVLFNKLQRLSIIIGSFAKEIVDDSGGYNVDGSLANPYAKVKIDKSTLKHFYDNLLIAINDLKIEDRHLEIYEEVYAILYNNFLSENGSLNQGKLLNTNADIVISKLLLFENLCFFLIVKHT